MNVKLISLSDGCLVLDDGEGRVTPLLPEEVSVLRTHFRDEWAQDEPSFAEQALAGRAYRDTVGDVWHRRGGAYEFDRNGSMPPLRLDLHELQRQYGPLTVVEAA